MIFVGTRVREVKTGLVGRILSLHDCGIQGNLAVIRLDKEDPLYGNLTTAFEGEVEILEQEAGKGVSE